MLKRDGLSTKIIDFDLLMRLESWEDEEFLSAARRHLEVVDTKLFGITTICSNYAIALLLANLLKEIHPTAKVIFGGPQASLVPLETLETFAAVDLIVCGEGEETLIELLHSDFSTENLRKIAGLAIRVEGKPLLTPRRKVVAKLDDIPFPDFSLIPMEKYNWEDRLGDGNSFANLIEAGRGCPYNCTFCSTCLMWSRRSRMKSPSRIFREMKVLHERYGLDQFRLVQDNFTSNQKFLAHFCDFFQRYNSGFSWKTDSRIDCLDEGQLQAMSASGCRRIYFGMESASPRMQNIINKHLNLEGVVPLLRQCANHGIAAETGFMIGFPEETIKDIEATLAAGIEYRHSGVNNDVTFTKVVALAGTQIFKEQLSNLILYKSPDISWGVFPNTPEIWRLISQYPHLFSYAYSIPNPHVSEDTIVGLVHLFNIGTWYYHDAISYLQYQLGYRPWQLWEEWKSWNELIYSSLPLNYKEAAQRFPSFAQSLISKQESLDSQFLDSSDIFAFMKDY